MKFKGVALCFCSLIFSLLCGCGGASSSVLVVDENSPDADGKHITFYGNRTDGYSLSVIEDALQSFTSSYGVNAVYEGAGEGVYFQALDRRINTGNTDDIFYIGHDRYIEMTKSSLLEDISGEVDISLFNDFAKSQAGTSSIYSLPASISTYGIFVNYDYLDDCPNNLKELSLFCDNFVKTYNKAPIILNSSLSLSSLIYAKGMYDAYCRHADIAAEIQKYNSDPSLLTESFSLGIDFVYDMRSKGWVDFTEGATTSVYTEETDLFLKGDRPFMVTSGRAADILDEKNPSFDYGVFPYPIIDGDSILVAKADMICVKKGATDGTKNLIKRLATSEFLLELNDNRAAFCSLDTPQIYAQMHIIPSANFLVKNKCVIYGDTRLTLPIDYALDSCMAAILSGESREQVKNICKNILEGEK